MIEIDSAYEQRSAGLWATLDDHDEESFLAAIEDLVTELPAGSPLAAFERGCAQDSHGHSDRAVPLYRQALAGGLDPYRRRRATIQMSSSLRNIGALDEATELLTAELARPADELSDAVVCTLALCLADAGREREALSMALQALAAHLPRYQRSMTNYARGLVETVS
ncbi:tetratricopeptide (TPR) repeat protein [Allocatelliglobosispora scoriae]|uniref:Tetratricopeptide (TPR) repeat protein n=1 Tax=Allocatelliglobosispora scoriae TaxID=643052 RepID=A0A841C086_9ACTN|nr:tetratricopeptide repeat protein [Allocatelliglobosispora scoriae]MBB5872759.1 tetratricopeptide (TPR) repeat protein [Allocatelliglobosispora scoriae]